jgi:hypothetical protein
VKQIVDFLSRQDYISGLFTDDTFGEIPGALPLSAIYLKGSASLPEPAVVINFRSFATNPSDPVNSAVTVVDNVLQEGQGQHGSFSRADTYNFMAAFGPDFKSAFVDNAPVSNADVEVTIAHILGFHPAGKGNLTGRVLTELLIDGPSTPGKVTKGTQKSKPAKNGEQTLLRYQQLGKTRYFDAAGFEGKTVGL